MDRYWLLTNTTYGNWLPGDERGFVGQVWEHRTDDVTNKSRVRHDIPGTPYDDDMPGLERRSRELMKGPPIHLTAAHADPLFDQFQETAGHRGWEIRAVSIMFNHFHMIVGVPGDPKPGKILGDFKSWGTRKLSALFGAPASETWWTERGSKRKLADERAVIAGVHYVLYKQPNPILTWSPDTGFIHGGERRGLSPTCLASATSSTSGLRLDARQYRRTFALIPAAGQSRRMGRPKLALPLGERTVLEHVVAAVRAGGVEEVLVVIGPGTVFLQPLAAQAGACVHVLPEETPDMRTTAQAGLAWLEEQYHPSDDDAWLLLPADHPTLAPAVVRALLDASAAHPLHSIFLPVHQEKRGHPTLLRWRHVAALRAWPDGQGLNAYIRGHVQDTVELPWPTDEVLIDLDTPADYARLL